MSIKTEFSIKDLENLSGVKAHTIRIWEKRYNLLEPSRTETNIRKYDLHNLKRLLNVTFLYNEGYKISKIASFDEHEILKLIDNLALKNKEDYAIQAFKTAMFDFDHHAFNETFNNLSEEFEFREIFYNIFVPLLGEVGLLWQIGTIDPSHERFLSELIKQKIIITIDKAQEKSVRSDAPSFALYLPYEEVHEIGLLLANYEIISAGYNSIYLGTNIPLESLQHILKHHNEITFLSYFTVKPDTETVKDYALRFEHMVNGNKNIDLILMGSKVMSVEKDTMPSFVEIIPSVKNLREHLEQLKYS